MPADHGWRVKNSGASRDDAAQAVESLADAASAAPAGQALHLALPTSAVLMERMRLPSKDRDELEGMMRLQLEKTLPFSADEVTAAFEIIEQTDTESLLLALAANNDQLDAMCEPLRAQRRLPEKITPFAMHVAANCSKGEIVCAIYREQDALVLAIVQDAKLSYAQTIFAADASAFFSDLPQILLSAELDGVPVVFNRVQLDKQLADWHTQAREFFAPTPVDLLALDAPLPEPTMNLVPEAWLHERRQLVRAGRLRARLILAGVFYLALLLCAAGYVIWLQRQVARINQQIAITTPQVESIGSRKARWSALAPAIDPRRYTVEILHQVSSNLPSEDIRITVFDQTPAQFMVEGEAPTAALALDYSERLKSNPELKDFKFDITPPTILPNEHAQFRIFGKL